MEQQNPPDFLDKGNGVKLLQDKNRYPYIPAPGNPTEVQDAVTQILYILGQLGVFQVSAALPPSVITAGVATQPNYQPQQWPAWRYGPDGQSQIFEAEEQVPDGWVAHPDMLERNVDITPPTTADAGTGDAPDPYKDMSDDDLKKELDNRKISYQAKWPRDKLISLLKAAEAK